MNKNLLLILVFILLNSYIYSFEMSKVGLGLGVGAGYEFKTIYRTNEYLSFSLDYNKLEIENLEFSGLGSESDDTSTTGLFRISGLKALAHLHPFGNGFRLSGGYTYNLTDISMNLEGNSVSLDAGGTSIDTSLDGKLSFDFGGFLPYLGVGWGYNYEDFISFDFSIGIQFVKKISDETIQLEASIPESDLTTLVTAIGTIEGLTSAQITQVVNASKDDIFELENALSDVGVETSSYNFPKTSDFIGEIEDQVETLVDNTGLGALQDILGYAPLPVVSVGFTIFLWN